MKKRILHIYKSYFPDTVGGVEETIKNIVDATQGDTLEHTVLTLSDDFKDEQVGKARVIRFPTTFSLSSCPVSAALLFKYRSLVESFDLLHYHFPWPFAETLQVLLPIKKPYVVTYHSDIVKQNVLKPFYRPFFKKFLANAEVVAVTSQNYLNTSEDLKPYVKKCEVIPLGIPDLPLPDEDCIAHWKEAVGENFLLFIGVLRYYKGLSVLLDALKGKPVPVVIAGDGPCRASLEAQSAGNGLTSLHFVGKVTEADKRALLKLSRGVVLPSNQRSEAFGIALLEGLAAGKPLISMEIGTGTSFINQAGETGWVVRPNSPKLLRDAIEALFSDDLLVQKFSKAARSWFEQCFTSEKMGKKYQALYRRELSASDIDS